MRRFIAIALVLVSSAATSAAWATPISDKYAQLGGAGGFLGQPTIAETPTPDGVGRYRHYEVARSTGIRAPAWRQSPACPLTGMAG